MRQHYTFFLTMRKWYGLAPCDNIPGVVLPHGDNSNEEMVGVGPGDNIA